MQAQNFSFLFLIPTALLLTHCGSGGSGQVQSLPTLVALLQISGGTSFDFGSHPVNQVTNQEFTVSNNGVVPATQISGSFYLSFSFVFVGGSFPGQGGTCGTTLESGATCTVEVSFVPQAQGLSQSPLQISYNNGSSVTMTTYPLLVGTGI
jgi:hypothetical protein